MKTRKATLWRGYYRPYVERAKERGVNAVQLLDEEWYDGRKSAECVRPYVSRDSVVLEIACGIGRVSRFVAPHCRHLSCADILEEALREARRNLAVFDNVSFHEINGYDLRGFGTEEFDCVYSFTTFFHFDFELVVHYFAEMGRVLKPGGIGLIEFKRWCDDRDLDQLLSKIERVGGIEKYETKLDKWRYVSKEMLRILCARYRLDVLDDDTTKYTFRKPT